MPLLFGYGSLLNLYSASRTLGRGLKTSDFLRAELYGYRRTWTGGAPIHLKSDDSTIYDALFLDLSPASAACPGVVIEVSSVELEVMDVRERQYERIDATVNVRGQQLSAFTYVVPAEVKTNSGFILNNYMALLTDGLVLWGDDFAKGFWATTDYPRGPFMDGDYCFADKLQNKAAGR